MSTLNQKPPFFIVGSVRSGTTILRDVLRIHKDLVCPEETHFFRWSFPFGATEYKNNYLNKVLRVHRSIDKVSDEKMMELLDTCHSRKDFSGKYIEEFIKSTGANPESRWFDKTPQNLYNLMLISAEFLHSRFIHIYRNPLNVVASLKVGEVMSAKNNIESANYWREATMISHQFSRCFPNRVMTIRYDDFTNKPNEIMGQLCEFIGEENIFKDEDLSFVRPETPKYKDVLTDEEIKLTKKIVQPAMDFTGYEFDDY